MRQIYVPIKVFHFLTSEQFLHRVVRGCDIVIRIDKRFGEAVQGSLGSPTG